MSRVQELQEIERFASANLPQNDAVGAVAEGCFEKIPDRHGRKAVLFPASFKADEILLRQLNLGRIFDDEHPFILRDELPKDRKQGRFASASPAANQNVLACEDVVFEKIRQGPAT